MKNLYPITHRSALNFWRNAESLELLKQYSATSGKSVNIPKDYSCPTTQKIATIIHDTLKLDYPITLMQPSQKNVRNTKMVKCFARPKAIPDKSFISIQKNVVIASPEYCFLLFSKELEFENLVELANNLCSQYFFAQDAEHGQVTLNPVCSITHIEEFLKTAKNFKGIKQARKAIKYAIDKSKSPMESKLAAAFTLSIVRGGVGFPKMEANYRVFLVKSAVQIIKCDYLECDLVWPEEKVIVEYDSDETHLESKQHAKDKAKVNALNLSGYRVITITKNDLSSFEKFDAMADVVRKALGLRSKKKLLDKYKERRRTVIKNLFYVKEPKKKKRDMSRGKRNDIHCTKTEKSSKETEN